MEEIKSTPKIKKIQAQNFFWLDICNPEAAELEFLRKTFGFHPLDLDDIRQKTQRSKIDKYNNYLFCILLFPVYDKKNKIIRSSEVDFFCGNDFLVTIHKKEMPLFEKIYNLCSVDQNSKEKILGNNPAKLMYETLDRLYTYTFPMLDHISSDLEAMEKNIFEGQEKEMVANILTTRRNITNFRKIMQPHRKVVQKTLKTANPKNEIFSINNGYEIYFDNLIDHAKEIWESLDALKEGIEALHETNESIISHKLNQTMKRLTAVSVILLPMSIMAALWGINVPVPFKGDVGAFFIVSSITVFSGILFAIFFKIKKWI